MWIETNIPDCDFFVPEAGHFTHPWYSDTTLLGDTILVERKPYVSKQGNKLIHEWTSLAMPDGTIEEVLVAVYNDDGNYGIQDVLLTRGHLACMAVYWRRWAYTLADSLWSVPSIPTNLYERNRARMSNVDSKWVHQRALRWYRKDPRYHKPATRAHWADFRWRWTIHTAARLGYLYNQIRAENKDPASIQIAIEQLLKLVDQRPVKGRSSGAQSQLDRTIVLVENMLATRKG
jgi:hypothetical protein